MTINPKLDKVMTAIAIICILGSMAYIIHAFINYEESNKRRSPLMEADSPWAVIYTDECPPSLTPEVCEDGP